MRWFRRSLAVAVLLGLAGVAWFALQPPTAQPDLTAADRLESGMTLPEVEAAFGLPPGDYRRDPTSPVPSDDDLGLFVHRRDFVDEVREWRSDTGLAQVGFDADGRLVAAERAEIPQPIPWHRRFRDRLRSWIP